MQNDFKQRWEGCLELIRSNVGESAFKAWFVGAEAVSFADNTLVVKLPTPYVYELYENEYYNLIRAALNRMFSPNVTIEYDVPIIKDDSQSTVVLPSHKKSTLLQNKFERTNFQKPAVKGRELHTSETNFDPQLNPALNFENYCVGESNRLAFTIADYVSKHPRNSSLNPFFLYGDVGVGKTHLIQAIGIRIKEQNPTAKVLFTTMKQFQTLYATAAINKKIPDFINWFMMMDVLLFDDLQEISGKVKTTDDALFPIFNHLHQNGKQLVFTCDRPPMELDGIADRLIDRFKWGITERLPKPDAALRKMILKSKARNNGLDIPEDVIDYIAAGAISSVRELEGIVMGILTRSITLNAPINLELAKEVMKNTVKIPVKKVINFDMIVETTAEFFSLNPDVIFSKSRVRDINDARQIIMYLSNKLTGLSSVAIGNKLKRQHGTVLHGITAVKERISVAADFAHTVEEIEKAL